MKVNILKLNQPEYPAQLRELSVPPAQIYWRGAPPQDWLNRPKITIVGSRKMTAYGAAITHDLTYKLARAGVVIVSGLAYGVDGVAHKAALEAGGVTVAVLGTYIDRVYPAAHYNLANQMINSGGTLISECGPNDQVFKSSFVARNRIVSALSDGLLITEAAINGGSLHTARFALEQGKTVMAVPGNITSPNSVGCNNLIKSGATPVTDVEDIFFALNIQPPVATDYVIYKGTAEEEAVLQLIRRGTVDQEDIATAAGLSGAAVNSALTMLEIAGAIKPGGGGNWLAV
jgi:DNA processing protein